jgi:hypothetical protein
LSRCDNAPADADTCNREHEAYTVSQGKCKRIYFRGCATTNYFSSEMACRKGEHY